MKIAEAEHSENMVIRTAIVAQKHKLLTVTLRSNYSLTAVAFSISGSINQTEKVKLNFNVTFQTTGSYETITKPSISPTSETTRIPTVPLVKKDKDFKAIKILYSNLSINYWTVINGSIPKPTWIEVDAKMFGKLLLVQYLTKPIETFLGYLWNMRSLNFRSEIFRLKSVAARASRFSVLTKRNVGSGDEIDTPCNRLFQNEATRNLHQDKGEYFRPRVRGLPSQIHNRRLLSIDHAEEGQLSSHYDPGELEVTKFSTNVGAVPSQDEIFLANWIADTKRKQLSYQHDLEKSSRAWRQRYGDWDPLNRDVETSFLPWERLRVFERLKTRQKQNHDEYSTLGRRGRKLLDTFADSLLHVHHIYNRKFGYAGRKVPAHMPHMIDVKVIQELQHTFPEEFDRTSSHKLRSSDDMQFAFSYIYFVIGQTSTLNVTKLFRELDTDHSGALSHRELRTLATRIYPLPLAYSNVKKLEKTLINCSLGLGLDLGPTTSQQEHQENKPKPALPLVTESLLSACTEVTKLLNESKGITKKYKHETVGDEDIWFKMISNNATLVLTQLDNIRARKKKFVCLNDNIDHSQNATLVRALLVDFYKSLFPIPSQFELPANFRNRFLYVDDLNEWKRETNESEKRNHLIIVAIAVFLLMCKSHNTFRGFE
ncbi:hypothetical protein QZH41_005971 [Actinostola sp. cb2023]|nr:hypothetical protein QZH41_005971 [Actinostola sp. cb2023]